MDAIVVARLTRAHGLEGEVFAAPETGDAELLFTPGREFGLAGGADPTAAGLTLEAVRPHKGGYLLKFREIGDRQAAESMRGRELTLPAESLRPLEEDEYFLHELVGLEAWVADGDRVGEVVEVYDLGAQILLEVSAQGRAMLVPFRRETIARVDRENGRVWIAPPPGLLEL